MVLFATGHMVEGAGGGRAAGGDGLQARVINVSTIKPLDEAAILAAAARFPLL